MMRRLLRWVAWVGLAALLPAAGHAARAEAADAIIEAAELPAGALAEADLEGGGAAFRFVAASNSVYDVCLFPWQEGEANATARLWLDGELLAEGGGLTAISQRLIAGEAYEITLSGSGRVRLEVARHALSRCFAMPMPLDAAGDAYAKAIAREGDVHWYRLDSDAAMPAMPAALAAIPAEDGLRLTAQLFGEDGGLLAEGRRTAGGACLMDYATEAGGARWLRVSAPEGGVGLYELRLEPGAQDAAPGRIEPPSQLSLSRASLVLEGRSSFQLTASFSPEGTGSLVYWESSDVGVARVDAQGVVTGRSPGEAVVTAYGACGVSAQCRVEVRHVPATGVRLLAAGVTLNVGDDAAIECAVLPENASDPRVEFSIAPGGVAEIDRRGVLRGVAEGEAVLTVRARDGGWEASIPVSVGPAPRRWRALLVGEQGYAATVAAVRTGSANSVAAIRSMLGALSMDGARWQVNTRLDASRDGVLAAIGEAFAGASEGDMNLFYITCHGYYAGGMTYFQMYDGSVLAAAELARALAGTPGEWLVIVDCCGSGGVIGRASGTGDILKGIDAVFGGLRGPAVMGGSRCRVLASAALEQDSYRISFDEAAAESGMATVFARALCEAGGWSIDRGARGALRADADYDDAVTLGELHSYTARRVMRLLALAGRREDGAPAYVQTVQAWPEGCGDVVFARTGG